GGAPGAPAPESCLSIRHLSGILGLRRTWAASPVHSWDAFSQTGSPGPSLPSGPGWHEVRCSGLAKGAHAMNAFRDIRDSLVPTSLFAAWTVTTGYTIMLIADTWIA